MSQPNFQAMNRKQLLSYVFDHRNDQDAFYGLMNKLTAAPFGNNASRKWTG